MSSANVLKESLPAAPEAARPLRRALERYVQSVGVDAERQPAICTAFAEAVANVITHAYRDEPGAIRVSAFVTKGELWIKVADDGIGCNEPAAKPGLGLGLGLMADACDRFEIEERRSGGTLVTMRFRLDRETAGAD